MRNLGIILGVTLIVIISAYLFVIAPKINTTDTNLKNTDSVQTHSGTTPTENYIYDSDNDRYIPYSSGLLETTMDTKRVLYFYANWCPTCIPADKAFSEGESQIPQDVTLIRVNYNDTETDEEEKELARKYGITYQHTFVQINVDGNEVAKWNGGGLAELIENIR